MAGTESTQPFAMRYQMTAIILVRPQLGENIGKAVRAMYNFGLTDLRLVAPRDGWPNPDAVPAAAGADMVLENAKVFDDLKGAVADLHHVYATTARRRDMVKPVVTPRHCADLMRDYTLQDQKIGMLFGPEKAGLRNDEVALADAIVSVPLNPSFASINLAQAVILMAYEWFQAMDDTPDTYQPPVDVMPATKADLIDLYEHLEYELVEAGFLRYPQRRALMVRNLRNMLERARFTRQEVSTLRGAIKALVTGGGPKWQAERDAKRAAAQKTQKT